MERMKTLYMFIISLIFVFGSISNIYGQENSDKKSTKSDPNEPIFEIKNDQDQTVFAVYPGGVKIFIDDSQLKASGGGFTVGRVGTEKASGGDIFSVNTNDVRVNIDDEFKASGGGFTVGRVGTEKASGGDFFTVQPNDVRVILDTASSLKASGGGFTVGRVGTEKADGDEENFLTVTPDSTRIHVAETSTSGFAVGKLGAEGTDNFLDLTPENYFIGHRSGENTTGLYNLFLGYESGLANTSGRENSFIGYKTGHSNIDGRHNVYLGYESGLSNTNGSLNVFIGYQTGRNSDISAHDNVYIGFGTARDKTEGSGNVMLGKYAGLNTGVGDYNVILGNYAGYGFEYTPGDDDISNNVIIGRRAANEGIGANNVIIGAYSGSKMDPVNSKGNVFIGNYAGYSESGSNRLYIDNSATPTPLLYGEFDSETLTVNGSLFYRDEFAQTSDKRLKTNIVQLSSGLKIVQSLNGYYFNWNDKAINKLGHSKRKQVGFIAQEVEKFIPEIISTAPNGYKAIAYSKIIPILVEAVKEQQKEIESLKQQVSEMDILKAEINELKVMVKEIAGTNNESKSESAK